MAHAVVVQVLLPEGGEPEEGIRMLNEQVIPNAKAQAGFQRGIWMSEGVNGMGIIVFDTAENAATAQEALKPPPGGPQLVSSTVYLVGAEA